MFNSCRKDTAVAVQTAAVTAVTGGAVDAVATAVEALVDGVVEDARANDVGFSTTAGQTGKAVGAVDAVAAGVG